jgi:hypothetical protein
LDVLFQDSLGETEEYQELGQYNNEEPFEYDAGELTT